MFGCLLKFILKFLVFLFVNQNIDTQLCKVKANYSDYACLSTSNFWKIFTIFFHIILKYNISKILEKKTISFQVIKWEIGIYL
jgi:hypothetical protein